MSLRFAPARSAGRVAFCLLFAATGSSAQDSSQGIVAEELMDEPPPSESPGETRIGAESDPEAEASRAYEEGDLPRAIAIYRELAASRPEPGERARLKVTAAWLLFESGDRSTAAEELTRALFENPGFAPRQDLYSPEFLALLLDAHAQAAIQRARAAVTALRDGLAAARVGERAKARALFGESLALAPNEPAAVHALAALDLAEGRSDDALAGFEKVLALERGQPERVTRALKAQTLNDIGVIYLGREQYQDAHEALARATALTPNDARAWFNLGLARLALGRKLDGAKALERAHELDRADPEITLRLARTYTDAGSWIEAVALLLEGTKAHPDEARFWLELGRAQNGLGNRNGMSESLRKAIDLDPANRAGVAYVAAMQLAESALAAGDAATAMAEARRAAAFSPAEAAPWALLGLAERGLGSYVEAAASLEKAIGLAPARADLQHNLGTVYLAQRRYVEAEAAFRKALAIDPAFVESTAALARMQTAFAAPADPRRSKKGGASAPPPRPRELDAVVSPVDYPALAVRGLLVEQVAPGGRAARGGLLVDDLIVRAEGRPVAQLPTLLAVLRAVKSKRMELEVLRSGKTVELQLPVD